MSDNNQQSLLSPDTAFMQRLRAISDSDVGSLLMARQSYGDSWCKRGGIGAFMMLARKMDRLENQCKKHGWNIFTAIHSDERPEGIMDDIRDLRRYLMLVEEHVGYDVGQVQKDTGEASSNYVQQDRLGAISTGRPTYL